ncbi:MAG: prepilin-type N-terminal cleavage/methylation domain-containing protein [Proteobacteria bacterium]|nr:prepilin-type N-terminal cleavage/methylation domain-containing protein [Pseudomonadota bacterium]
MLSCTLRGETRRPNQRAGFTLVEIVVATVILAVVLTIAYRVFSVSYAGLRQIAPERDLFHTARVILDRMADEIQSAYYRPGLAYTGFVGENDEKDDAPWDTLTFSTMANFYWIKSTEGIRQSDFLKISYSLVEEEEEEKERRLIRRQDPAFGPFEEYSEGIDSEDRGFNRLTDDVWGIDFRYFTGEEWVEDWNSGEQEKLPRAVEIELILETVGGKLIPFYAVVPIGPS